MIEDDEEIECHTTGKCEAEYGATGITGCIHCGGELIQVGAFWYHHSQFEDGKLISPNRPQWQEMESEYKNRMRANGR